MHDLFNYWKLNGDGKEKVEVVRSAFDKLLETISPCLDGGGRHEAVTKSKLEEACMYAIKAVCIQPMNQEHYEPRD